MFLMPINFNYFYGGFMGCCAIYDDEDEPRIAVDICSNLDCERDVDEDGECIEDRCTYSPVVCETCGYQPCDQYC